MAAAEPAKPPTSTTFMDKQQRYEHVTCLDCVILVVFAFLVIMTSHHQLQKISKKLRMIYYNVTCIPTLKTLTDFLNWEF